MERTPYGLIIPDRESLAELLGQQPVLTVKMPEVPGGAQFAAPLVSDLLVTDADGAVADLQDAPRIAVTSQAVMLEHVIPLVDAAAAAARAIVIVAPAFDEAALGVLVVNKLRGFIWSAALHADADVLAALARHVGVEVLATLDGVTFDQLGHAKRVVASRDATIIVK